MIIRSNDARPQYSVQRAKTSYLCSVPRQKCPEYAPGELVMIIHYRVPVLGIGGEVCLPEQFDTCEFQTTDLEYGYKFYRQKLASYNARLDTRHQRIIKQNRTYFECWDKMRQKNP